MIRTHLFCVAAALCASFASGQQPAQQQPAQLTPEQKQQVDAALPKKAAAKPKKARRLLVTSLCVRPDGRAIRGHPAIPAGNYAIEQMGKLTGAWETVLSNDMEMLRPEKLNQFDAVCFDNTQGVIFNDPALQDSLKKFITSGHGFIGFHATIATINQYPKFDVWPWFTQMLGATESGGHPWMPNDTYTVKVDDPKSPLNKVFKGKGLEITDEVFQCQEPNLRERFHVLLSIDMAKSKPSRPPLAIRKQDQDFPMSWIKTEEKGRVYYSNFGHNANVFWNPALLEHFLSGIQYALGDLKADARPSAKPASGKR